MLMSAWTSLNLTVENADKCIDLVSCPFSDMGCVRLWLVCVYALHVCIAAHSPQLDDSDHDHLDHLHHHLVSDGSAASGTIHCQCVRRLALSVFQCHHPFNLCEYGRALPEQSQITIVHVDCKSPCVSEKILCE